MYSIIDVGQYSSIFFFFFFFQKTYTLHIFINNLILQTASYSSIDISHISKQKDGYSLESSHQGSESLLMSTVYLHFCGEIKKYI